MLRSYRLFATAVILTCVSATALADGGGSGPPGDAIDAYVRRADAAFDYPDSLGDRGALAARYEAALAMASGPQKQALAVHYAVADECVRRARQVEHGGYGYDEKQELLQPCRLKLAERRAAVVAASIP
jgi:hypothetical protein